MSSGYYYSTIGSFLEEDNDSILNKMVSCDPQSSGEQVGAWKDTIEILKQQLSDKKEGVLSLEYTIPRINRRIDALVFYKNIIFVLEFKCGMKNYCKETYEQVIDYAFDLHFFHELSEKKLIVPIELPTEAPDVDFDIVEEDRVIMPIPCNKNNISKVIDRVVAEYPNEPSFDVDEWMNGDYKPTPTIIEAARILYSEHNVEDIKRHDSTNLTETIDTISEIITKSRLEKRKSICFVTGVPGAGKTLVGLTIAVKNMDEENEEHSTFLSGNNPLVETLVEALARDRVSRDKISKSKAKAAAESFIQHLRRFRNNGIKNPNRTPPEHVVIFDEAQRAWTKDRLKSFEAYRMKNPGYEHSEPESLIMQMDRHEDWAVIICLVGGGQEINRGEAGLSEWFNALRLFKNWDIYVTPELKDQEYTHDYKWGEMTENLDIHEYESLHLSVSMRSLRTDKLNNFVKSLLDRDIENASKLYKELGRRYPIVMTRNLDSAKQLIRKWSADCDRYGLVTSSNTDNIISQGEAKLDVPAWFLDDKNEPKSSCKLNRFASEFDVQGLELDYSIVQWGADFRYDGDTWDCYYLWDNRWTHSGPIKKNNNGFEKLSTKQLYLKNTYRVLLTRARKGMIFFIPRGNPYNPFDQPIYYDGVYNYLKSIGIEEIE